MDSFDHECKSQKYIFSLFTPQKPRTYYHELNDLFSSVVQRMFKKLLIATITSKCVACRRKNFPKLRPLPEQHLCLKYNESFVSAFDSFGLELFHVMARTVSIHKEIQTEFLREVTVNIPWLCPLEIEGQFPSNNNWKAYFYKSCTVFSIMKYVYEEDQNFVCFID